MPGILDIRRISLSAGCGGGSGALAKERVGASSIAVSDSDLMGAGVEARETLDTFRRGVGAGPAVGSFFLCERLPVLVRWGVDVPDPGRIGGEAGKAAAWEDAGRAVESAERASKSARWFAKVF